ncbi:hypothetical protein [Allorhizobium taibaishanense]|uniref:Uncharacterized protein n=1 Tax=Allorhizobium taibaishanense TaxID=887144 RepID=A0A7W6MSQ6_9HYPH|nr:hypothetical protein [Allorhizobium taibaishanense]MBB4006390.1 hypothetical protein [Allorhizobium taibaishanense]
MPVAADDLTSTPPEIACRNEMILLDVWQAQGVFVYVDYPRKDKGILHVGTRGWKEIEADQQRRIALAAFCPIAVQAGHGRLWLEDRDGKLLVVDGRMQF